VRQELQKQLAQQARRVLAWRAWVSTELSLPALEQQEQLQRQQLEKWQQGEVQGMQGLQQGQERRPEQAICYPPQLCLCRGLVCSSPTAFR
jgi:hypothetical protein